VAITADAIVGFPGKKRRISKRRSTPWRRVRFDELFSFQIIPPEKEPVPPSLRIK